MYFAASDMGLTSWPSRKADWIQLITEGAPAKVPREKLDSIISFVRRLEHKPTGISVRIWFGHRSSLLQESRSYYQPAALLPEAISWITLRVRPASCARYI